MLCEGKWDRRSFLASVGAMGTAPILAGCAAQMGAAPMVGNRKLDKIGIQLYTVRDLVKTDYIATIKMLAAIGYDQLEYAELPDMPYTAKEIRKVADGEGMTIPSSGFQPEHFFGEMQKVVEITGDLGATYAFNGWIHPPDRTLPGLIKQTQAFNRFGETLKKAGFKFMYHNHDFEFAKLDGDKSIQDILLQNTDPTLVDFEMDMFWVVHGGGNIIDYLTRYPGRFKCCHIKDRTVDGKMVDVGKGVIDWKTAIATAKDVGIEYYFVEHDEPAVPVSAAVAASYAYVRNLRF
jgi:sugar phosphate isomerase/epimerase